MELVKVKIVDLIFCSFNNLFLYHDNYKIIFEYNYQVKPSFFFNFFYIIIDLNSGPN